MDNAALAYLQRYASSAENLRAVLMRRVLGAAHAHDEDPVAGAALVDALVDRFRRAGLLDDRAYAEGRVATLHRRGVSARGIRARLLAKGVAADDIESALAALDGGGEGVEFTAACNYARRRRLGPWRTTARAERRDRDLASLARQGFGYELARAIVDAEDAATLESRDDP